MSTKNQNSVKNLLNELNSVDLTKTIKKGGFSQNGIYKSISEFEKEKETKKYIRENDIEKKLNRTKIRNDFAYFLKLASEDTNKENILKFMKFCRNVYNCFNDENLTDIKLYNITYLCHSNDESKLKNIQNKLDIIAKFIKENY